MEWGLPFGIAHGIAGSIHIALTDTGADRFCYRPTCLLFFFNLERKKSHDL